MEINDPKALNALQQKDIDFLKDALREVKFALSEVSQKFDLLNSTFARKEDVKSELDRLEKKVDLKVDSKEFEPIKSTLNKINLTIILAIVGAILTIIGVKAL